MKTVLVSGCFDVIHGGHVQFLRDARALGDRLVVSVAGDESLAQHKGRCPAMPEAHKAAVLRALACVDEVWIGEVGPPGLDFLPAFRALRPSVLAVAGDDPYGPEKCELVRGTDCQYVVLRKTFDGEPITTTEIRRRCRAPEWVPLRVDFAGGWLDVPACAREGGRIVNCAITPGLSLQDNWLAPGSGLGGSAAWAALQGQDPVEAELAAGVGWQDPAVQAETGMCVWQSGPRPRLEMRDPGDWLAGRMAIQKAGNGHQTASIAGKGRDLDGIAYAGLVAAEAAQSRSLPQLAHAMEYSYRLQLGEGMAELPDVDEAMGRKYLGAGWGGYALHLFGVRADRDAFAAAGGLAVEPYDRWSGQ